jgi:hypothetical protein
LGRVGESRSKRPASVAYNIGIGLILKIREIREIREKNPEILEFWSPEIFKSKQVAFFFIDLLKLM